MRIPKTIIRWWGRPGLDRELFEELGTRYVEEPEQVFEEFVRRLNRLVFQAALDFLTRKGQPITQNEVEELVMDVFRDFAPSFVSGSPGTLLRRFADAIRRVLDATAFQQIAYRYYLQGPIYHLKDIEQRKLLAAVYQEGLGLDVVEKIADRFDMGVGQVEDVITKASGALNRLIAEDFSQAELKTLTEGYLPP